MIERSRITLNKKLVRICTGPGFTLYHGDTLDILPELVLRGGNQADCLVCDPPYLLTSGGPNGEMQGKFNSENYDNGGDLFEDTPPWSEFMPMFFNILKEQAHCYTMADSKNQFEMQVQALAAGFRFHNLLTWKKGNCTPNRWYMKSCEYTGFFFKGAGFAINDCGSAQDIYIPLDAETNHPTEKPVLLMAHYLCNSTQPGQTVIDPFMGSGSTGVAAIRNGRKFVGIEKNPEFFDAALARISNANVNQQKMLL